MINQLFDPLKVALNEVGATFFLPSLSNYSKRHSFSKPPFGVHLFPKFFLKAGEGL